MKRIIREIRRRPVVAVVLWAGSVQYFAVLAAAITQAKHYSLIHDPISDLGNTACGTFHSRYVCSPLHSEFDISLIILGGCTVIGACLATQKLRTTPWNLVALALMVTAGVGVIGVGVVPENTSGALHSLWSDIAFLAGAIAILIFAFSLKLGKLARTYALLTSLATLGALASLFVFPGGWIDYGVVERVTELPEVIWLIIFGLLTMADRVD